jgi:sec-independent protein translocase protein TatA
MRLPGGIEWVIVLVIILLLFGPGRIGKIFGELGKGIRNFREGLGSKDQQEEDQPADSSGNIEPK